MVGDPLLTLPYWDWNDPNRDQLPPPYITPNDPTNPLVDANRGATPGLEMPAGYVNGTAFQNVMNASDWTAFMGEPAGAESNGGSLENGPHGFVHIWTGQPALTDPCGVQDMGILATAAQDPIFFSHHANIDRLWDVWLQASPSHTNPTEPASGPVWRPHTWTFYDENKNWVSIAVSDVIDHEGSLHYKYKDPTLPPVHAMKMVMATSMSPNKLSTEPRTVTAATSPAKALLQLPVARLSTGERLHIDGITTPPGGSALVRVFINLPSASAVTSVDDPHYVGYFAVVPHRGSAKGSILKKNVQFELTAANLSIVGASNQISVTLVPEAGNAKPRAVNLAYERVYLTVDQSR